MDVVKKTLESIGGTISVDTTLGSGTSIRLSVPASMAVKGTLLFEADETEYAIPLTYTRAVVSLPQSAVSRVGNGLVTSYLDKTISVIFLRDLFTPTTEYATDPAQSLSPEPAPNPNPEVQHDVVIVSYANRTLGLVVDKLLQQKEVVEKPLMKPVDRVPFVSGVTILGNGHVCLILHVPAIINYIFHGNHQRSAEITA